MGMSAGQARLLSITARLTDNELRSQMITNSKLRLADKSSEASEEYMNALNTTQLMYGSYSSDGTLSYQELTANVLLSYGDLKNQYSLVNSNGQILLSGSDIKKYQEANSLEDFLYSYGIAEAENPKYLEALEEIFGANYEQFYDEANPNKYTKNPDGTDLDYKTKLNEFASLDLDSLNENSYNTLKNNFSNLVSNAGLKLTEDQALKSGGIFDVLVDTVNGMPEYVEKVDKPEEVDLMDYAKDLLSPQCWDATGINDLRNGNFDTTDDEIWHMEHVLAQYLWSSTNGSISVNTGNGTETITNSGSTWGLSSGGGDGDDPMNVRGVLAKSENAELKEKLEQLYYQLALHIDTNNTNSGLTSGSITNDHGNALLSNEEIGQQYYELIDELLLAVANDILEAGPDDTRYDDLAGYESALTEYSDKLAAYEQYQQFKVDFAGWVNSAQNAVNNFEEYIDNLPKAVTPDETDARYQWYVNLYYRMGGGAENADGTKNSNNYKELDENLMNNAEWLQFALEHGILTMEQAAYSENGSEKYPEIGTYDWTSIIYTNANDLKSQEDETAIAIAEVKYKNTITEIENQDKKYDQDLKKLDSQHSALQTEYDSIKSVIDKNVERSFKAFS